jgi:ribonuclease BN (tRNA processing enzyme)
MRLIPLGSNGFIPTFDRQTMSFLLLAGADALLIDAGSGVGRLLEPQIARLLQPFATLNIILSHYHQDHTAGLAYLPEAWTQGRLRIYAPAPPFVAAEPEPTLHRLIEPPVFTTASFADYPTPVEIIPLREPMIQIGNLSLRLRPQEHPGGSMGIRIGDTLAYCTDTTLDQQTIAFAKGVHLLLHAVWRTDAEVAGDEEALAKSTYGSGVIKIAQAASVRRLMPIHHHPRRTNGELQQLGRDLQGMTGIKVTMPEEGTIYELES